MRAFLGIPIPEELRTKILQTQKEFSDFDIKFVEPENLHFNLKFFREISDENVEKLRTILQEICKKFQAFTIKIEGLGAFPNKNYIRVVWIGVKEGHNTMVSLAENIQNSIESLEFFEEEKFVPHLTLGRVRTARNKEGLKIKINELEGLEIGSMSVEEIVLFQSKLSPKGPEYEEVFKIKLG
jgi:2'-5' RNA ligase